MATQKPTIMIVHGAWHIPDHYEPFAKLLRNAGYEVALVRHPSVSIDSDPGNMLHEDAKAVADTLRQLVTSGQDVVLVMHSYGGLTGSEATATVSEELLAKPDPNAGRIRRLVYLAAHVLEKGVSFVGSGRAIPNTEINNDGIIVHLEPYERYYADVSREDAEPALAILQPMANSAFTTPTLYAGWKDYSIPCTYIKCLQDVALPGDLCDMYVSRLKDAGVDVTAKSLDTSHSPFWSAPDLLFEVFQRAVE